MEKIPSNHSMSVGTRKNDAKATTLETIAFVPLAPMVRACPGRLPSLRSKPPPPLTSKPISSSPSPSS